MLLNISCNVHSYREVSFIYGAGKFIINQRIQRQSLVLYTPEIFPINHNNFYACIAACLSDGLINPTVQTTNFGSYLGATHYIS